LEWSRIQTGKLNFDPNLFNLSQILTQTISLVKQTANNKNIMLDYDIDITIFVNADKNMLTTIVRNLVSNSIKFTRPGGKITIEAKKSDDFVEISIADTGLGISKEKLGQLFKMDKNVSTKGTANEEGTGLGLLLCKEMIEKHNGGIWVESEIGSGSKFYFTIPVGQ